MSVLRKLDVSLGWKPNNFNRVIKLVNVSEANNNKYYDMYDVGGGEFIAVYGRVDASIRAEANPISEWDSKYRSKLKKGYSDITKFRTVHENKDNVSQVIDIKDSQVKKFVESLQSFSNQSIKDNYTVTAADVTQAQVDKAQSILDQLVKQAIFRQKTDYINSNLLELCRTIPRKMANVRNFLLNFSEINTNDNLSAFKNIISNEQLTLDVMRGQVAQITNTTQATKQKIDILAAMGLAIELVNDREIQLIKKLLGSNSNQFSKAFKITNLKNQNKFNSFINNRSNKTTQLLWHGSRNENWWSILGTGLLLRPTNAVITGKMFGYGNYFANRAQKSLGYTSYRGSYWARGNSNVAYLALFNVHTGYQFRVGPGSKHSTHAQWMTQLTEDKLKKYGDYDCLFAKGGIDLRNDEIIVYNESQSTINYIVEIK